jgi:hypothetical protein
MYIYVYTDYHIVSIRLVATDISASHVAYGQPGNRYFLPRSDHLSALLPAPATSDLNTVVHTNNNRHEPQRERKLKNKNYYFRHIH